MLSSYRTAGNGGIAAGEAVTGQSSSAASGQQGIAAAAAQKLIIDPQELTLGALIGEGGFGKVATLPALTDTSKPCRDMKLGSASSVKLCS